jgi:hypothetical protein
MARVLPLGAGTCHFGRLRLSPGVHGRRPWPPDGLRRLRRLPRRVCPAQDSVEHYFDMVVLTLWVGVATKLRQVRFRATGVLGLARVSALGGRLRSVTVTTFPVRQIPRFPGSPGARRSYPSSVPARSRWAQPVDPHGPRRRARSAGPAGFGMGSVGEDGSVGDPASPSVSSSCSRRTGPSVVLKIRVSMVRFPPWPPLLSGCIPVTRFTSHSGHMDNTVSGAKGLRPGSTRS